MKWRRTLLVFVAWIVVLEGAAWLADSFLDFRYRLLDRLETATRTGYPIEESDPDWPEGQLRVRVPDRGDPRDEPHTIGGRVIENAWPDAKQELIEPGDLDTRPRVFVLGGSAAMGYPYAFDDSFAESLGRRAPRYRVVNAAQIGWASGQVLGVSQRILDHFDPEVLVVYSGNNEWIHWSPQSPERSFDPRIEKVLAHSRLLAGALFLGHGIGRRRHGNATEDSSLTGFAHAVRNPNRHLDVAAWAAQRQEYLDAFRSNLVALRDRARERGVRVVFLTVPFNYELSPSFRHTQPDSWDPAHAEEVRALISEAAGAIEADDCELAMEHLSQARVLDPRPAVIHYMVGVCMKERGRFGDAEDAFAKSRDRMVGNLGGRLAINEVIRDVAANGATLVDVAHEFDAWEHARGRWLNQTLIHDDCHPTPEGQRLIATLLAAALGADEGAENASDEGGADDESEGAE